MKFKVFISNLCQILYIVKQIRFIIDIKVPKIIVTKDNKKIKTLI